jgi:tetratricopeptide (TPR) repeat protein
VRYPGLSTSRARLRAAVEALRDNRPAHALEAADSAVTVIANRPEAHVLRGRALSARRAYEAAQSAFERALSLDKTALDEWEAGVAAATTALQLGDLASAAQLLTRVLAALPEPEQRAPILALQADVLQAQGPEQLQGARLTYRAALRGDRPQPDALLGLALAFHREGEVAEALHLAGRIEAEPEHAGGGRWALPESERLARRALWLQAIDDAAGALQAWQRAAALDGPWQAHAAAAARALATATHIPLHKRKAP